MTGCARAGKEIEDQTALRLNIRKKVRQSLAIFRILEDTFAEQVINVFGCSSPVLVEDWTPDDRVYFSEIVLLQRDSGFIVTKMHSVIGNSTFHLVWIAT